MNHPIRTAMLVVALVFVVGFCSAPFHASATRDHHCTEEYPCETPTTTASTSIPSTTTASSPSSVVPPGTASTTTALASTSSSSTSTTTSTSSLAPDSSTSSSLAPPDSSSPTTPPSSPPATEAPGTTTAPSPGNPPCSHGQRLGDRVVDENCEPFVCYVYGAEPTTDYRLVPVGTAGSTAGPGPLPCEPIERLTDDPPVRQLPSTGIDGTVVVIGALLLLAGGLLVATSRHR